MTFETLNTRASASPSVVSWDPGAAVALVADIEDNRIVLPWDRHQARPPDAGDTPYAAAVGQGERAELVDRQYGAASEPYKTALSRARTPGETASAQLLLARALSKASRGQEAVALYRGMLAIGADLADDQGVPFALYAARRLLDLTVGAAEDVEAVVEILERAATGELLSPPGVYMARDVAVRARGSTSGSAAPRTDTPQPRSDAVQKRLEEVRSSLERRIRDTEQAWARDHRAGAGSLSRPPCERRDRQLRMVDMADGTSRVLKSLKWRGASAGFFSPVGPRSQDVGCQWHEERTVGRANRGRSTPEARVGCHESGDLGQRQDQRASRRSATGLFVKRRAALASDGRRERPAAAQRAARPLTGSRRTHELTSSHRQASPPRVWTRRTLRQIEKHAQELARGRRVESIVIVVRPAIAVASRRR